MRLRLSRAVLLTLAMIGVAPAARAQLAAAPVSFDLVGGQKAASVEISNPGDAPINVQVRVFRWSQDGETDQYEPTDDIGFSPPLFELEPGAKQIVRMAWRGAAPAREMAYRIFVDQLPRPDAPGVIQMPVRMVLPFFVSGARAAPPQIHWRLEPGAEPDVYDLVAANSGGKRMRVKDLAFLQDDGLHPIQMGLAGYVLAGESRSWSIRLDGEPPATLAIRAASDDGEIAAEAPLSDK